MTKIGKTAPFLHSGDTVRSIEGDMLIALLPPVVIAVMKSGFRSLFLCALSAAAAWIAASALLFLFKRRLAGPAAAGAGLLVALLCPVSAPWWLPALGGTAAALLQILFGLLPRPPFHPAALIWLLLGVFFPSYMHSFPAVSADNIPPVFGGPPALEQGVSIAHLLQLQVRPPHGLSQLLVGNIPGAMGTTSLLLIAACAVYLIYRRAIAWQAAAGMTGICALLGLLVDRGDAGPGWSMLFELSAAGFLFAAVYVAAAPGVSPRLPFARLLYGVLCGALTMIFRYLGMENSCVPAAILLAQLASPPLDRLVLYMRQGEQRDFYRPQKWLLVRYLQKKQGRKGGSKPRKR